MPDNTDTLVDRLQGEFDVDWFDESTIMDYLTDNRRRVGSHQIKDGFSSSGKQRYKTSKGISSTGFNNIARLARELSESRKLKVQAERVQADTSDIFTKAQSLRGIKTGYSSLKYPHPDVGKIIDSVLNPIEKEESRIIGEVESYRSEVESIKSLTSDEQKELFKSGTKEERELAAVALREESPRVLGGLISGESRAIGKAIRKVFGE